MNHRTLVVALMVALVVASCSTGPRAPEPEKPIAGDVSVCGLATAAEIEQATGEQVERFSMYSSSSDTSFTCTIYFVSEGGADGVGVDFSDYRPRHPYLPFEEIAAPHRSDPVEVEGLDGQGVARTDSAQASVIWAYPDGNTYTTLTRIGLGNRTQQQLKQDTEQLTALLTLIGAAVPQVAQGPRIPWTAYPSDPATAE